MQSELCILNCMYFTHRSRWFDACKTSRLKLFILRVQRVSWFGVTFVSVYFLSHVYFVLRVNCPLSNLCVPLNLYLSSIELNKDRRKG